MVARNPLVLIAGTPAELPTGDTINGAGGGGSVSVVFARIRSSANQSIPTGATYVDVAWNASAAQVGGAFWTTGATVTIPETGYYQIDVEGTFEGAAVTVTCNMQVIVNGSAVIGDDERMVAAGATAALLVNATRLFTAGDTIKAQVKHSSATALNLITQGDHSPDIRLTKIGGAKGDAGSIPVGVSMFVSTATFLS
jgi:hypothetical protein